MSHESCLMVGSGLADRRSPLTAALLRRLLNFEMEDDPPNALCSFYRNISDIVRSKSLGIP